MNDNKRIRITQAINASKEVRRHVSLMERLEGDDLIIELDESLSRCNNLSDAIKSIISDEYSALSNTPGNLHDSDNGMNMKNAMRYLASAQKSSKEVLSRLQNLKDTISEATWMDVLDVSFDCSWDLESIEKDLEQAR